MCQINCLFLFICFTNIFLIANVPVEVDNYVKWHTSFSGAILITHDKSVVFKKAYGFSNRDCQKLNTTDTQFLIASNTKLFTAIAIMHLQEKKLLSVHDKLSKYIPDFPHANNITIHHLLTHASGISNYYKYWSDIEHCASLESIINKFKPWDLEFKPGSQYQYSNSGYLILAYIIEKVSGKSYAAYLKEHVFKPLGMRNTGNYNTQNMTNKAYGYVSDNGLIHKAENIINPITLIGNGDIYSTIDDMFLFDQALYSGKIISNKSLALVFAPYMQTGSDRNRFHGYGCFVDKKCGKAIIEYSGSLRGFLSKIIRFVEDKISIIILTNVEDKQQFFKICDELPEIAMNYCNQNKTI